MPKSAARLRAAAATVARGRRADRVAGNAAGDAKLTAVIIAFLGLGVLFVVFAFTLAERNPQASVGLPTLGVGLLSYMTFIFTHAAPLGVPRRHRSHRLPQDACRYARLHWRPASSPAASCVLAVDSARDAGRLIVAAPQP